MGKKGKGSAKKKRRQQQPAASIIWPTSWILWVVVAVMVALFGVSISFLASGSGRHAAVSTAASTGDRVLDIDGKKMQTSGLPPGVSVAACDPSKELCELK